MPLNIIKHYSGQNIIKVRRAGGIEKYGYRITISKKEYIRAEWDTKRDAEAARDKLKRKLLGDDYDEYKENPITIADLADAWERRAKNLKQNAKRILDVKATLNRLKEVAASQSLVELTQDDLLRYQASRQLGDKPKHNHTINRELAMIRTAFLAAPSLFPGFNWMPPRLDRHQRLPQLHDGREAIISPEDHHRIVAALTEDASIKRPGEKYERHSESNIAAENARRAFVLDAYLVASETGLRISELASLKKKEITFARGIGTPHGHIRLTSAKSHKRQSVPMTPAVAEILKRRCDLADGEYLFRAAGQSLRMAVLGIRRGFKRACERAGVAYGGDDGAVFHTTRHTFATRLVNSGVSLSTAARMTRHSKKTMLMRYAHSTPESIENAVRAMSLETEMDSISVPEKSKKQ